MFAPILVPEHRNWLINALSHFATLSCLHTCITSSANAFDFIIKGLSAITLPPFTLMCSLYHKTYYFLTKIKMLFARKGEKLHQIPFHYSLLLITCQKSTRGFSEKWRVKSEEWKSKIDKLLSKLVDLTDGRKATLAPFHYSLLLITCQKSTRGFSEKWKVKSEEWKSKIDKLLSKLVDFWQGWKELNPRQWFWRP